MKYALLIILIALYAVVFGQSVSPGVVATAGGTFSNGNIQLDWTIGEPVIETIDNGMNILTQGFHQPDIFTVATQDFRHSISLSLYPNPVQDRLYIQGFFDTTYGGHLTLSNILGQPLWTSAFSGESISASIDMLPMPPGTYLLSLASNGACKGLQVIKVK